MQSINVSRYLLPALAVFAMFFILGEAYPNGAPLAACAGAQAIHTTNGSPVQPLNPANNPYSFTLEVEEYIPGQDLEVTIEEANGGMVNGFFLQARRTDTGIPVGTFQDPLPTGTQLRQCTNAADSVTHTNPNGKTGLTFTWLAPVAGMGEVEFVGAVALDHNNFYGGMKSAVLAEGNGRVSSSCDDIGVIDFAEITYEPDGLAPHPEGTNASIECGVFYQIVPSEYGGTTCVNGAWTGTLPKCRHIPRHCQRNDNLVQIYGRDCEIRCRNRLEGACPSYKRCYCDGACGWSCIAIYADNFCPEVREQAGLLVSYDPPERRFNGYANFSCSEGYRYHSGSSRLRCMSNGQWGGGREFICMPNVVCGDAPTVNDASLQPSSNYFFLPGDTRTYSCNLGYTIYGSRQITCGDNYEWSQPQFSCRPRSCGYPGTIPNADLTTRRFQFTDRAIYECREGYENPPYTPSYRTCQANGEWSFFVPVCEPIRCPEIHSLENGGVNSWGNTYESHITFHCDDGYHLEGSARRVCLGDKTWSGEETVCVEIICDDPGVPRNGYKTNEKPVYRLNDVVYFGCNDGYTMDGSVSNYCRDSGEWAHPVPVCGENCIVPSYPRNGWWRSDNQYRRGTSVPHNTRLQVWCYRQFNKRQSSIQCNDGTWSDSDDVRPLCEGTPCSVRYSAHLTITYDPPVSEEDLFNTRIPHDTRVRYACERGYLLTGVTEARCNHGSYGRSSVPRCEPVPCPEEEIAHGRLIYVALDGSSKRTAPVHGDTRRLKCNSGYRSTDFTRSHCDNRVWVNEGGESLRCLPKPCDPIPETQGSVTYSTAQRRRGKYSNGTEVRVGCHSGYLPAIGDGTAVCIASTWWTAVPTCELSNNKMRNASTSQTPSKETAIGNSWLARDGNTDSAPNYCSRTGKVLNPWWKAVMTSINNITDVKIYNRLDREEHKYDLAGAEIRIGMEEDHTRNPLCGEPITRDQINSSTVQNHGIAMECRRGGINGIIGRIISVHIPANEKRELSLCEVEVFTQGEPYSVNGAMEGAQVGCVVPFVENARIDTYPVSKQQVILVGRTVRFTCHSGYNLRENGSDPNIVDLRCLSNSSWDKAEPVCVPQTCTVERLHNGGFPERRITYTHGENITFMCNPGFQQQYESYWCDRGTALPTNPRCVQASCNAPDLPDHMISSQSRFAHGSLLSVSCERGFQLSSNQQQPTCLEGAWNESVNVACERVPCPGPGTGSYGTLEPLRVPGIVGYVHGARIRYSCIEGWEIQGIAERVCDNGHWTGSPPACRRAAPPRCMLPERSNGERYYVTGYTGNIFDEGLPIGESADISVRCNPGSVPQSAVSATCLNGGVWSVSVPICVRMQRLCSKPRYISHVVQYVNGLEINELTSYPHDELPEGTFLLSHCSLPGQYVLQGSANRTCSEGRWTGVEPRCVASETQITFQNNQPLEIRSDGTIVIFPRGYLFIYCRMPSNSNKAAHFTSDSGVNGQYWKGYGRSFMAMTLDPPSTSQSGRFTCRSYDNSLSHSVFIQFAEIYCDRPSVPTNGELHDYDSGWKHGRYYMGKLITYTCNSGYSLDGERRITCVFGQWSDPVPRCRRATCPELQPPTHGTKIGGNRIGDSVMIGCNYGYQLQGETFLDCLESGEWSHPLPNCTDIEPPTLTCPEDISSPMNCENSASTISWDVPVATDNSGLPVQLKATLPVWHGISATVTYTATDAAGNTANCSFTITVTDSANCSLEYLRTFPKNASVYIGEDHTFECSPQESSWSVSWEKDGQRLDSRATAGSNLMLKDIEQEDEGLYTCIVDDCWGRTKTRADAWLYVTPKIDISKVCGTITFWKENDNSTSSVPEEMTMTETDVEDIESINWSSSLDNAAGRIVGGHETKNGSAPYMVGIWKREDSAHWTFHCGASLLDQMWIMTAAHCMFNAEGVLLGKEELRLIFGDFDTLTTEGSEETRKPSEIIMHEEYNKETLDNDIALIRIEPPLREFTPYIRPICLAPAGLSRNLTEPDTLGRVTGWGRLSFRGVLSKLLRAVELPVVDWQTCRESVEEGWLTDNMLCAGYPSGGRDACLGDSGGPFTVRHNDGRWYQVGIVSWGTGCARPGEYGIYTRVSRYLQWIHSKNVTVAYSPRVRRQLNEKNYTALVFRARAASHISVSEGSDVNLKCFPSVDNRTVQRYSENNQDYKPCGEAGNVLAGDSHQANEKAWPWLSRIHRNSAAGSQMMCSGTLICQQWVLTTSSCFANIPDSEVIGEVLVIIGEDSQAMPEEITVTVTLGEYNVSIVEGCEQTIEVDRIILHDQYNRERLHDYDIALLHLSQPVELNSYVRTICLPSEMDTPHDPTVVGWGTASGLPENAHDVPLQYPMPLATQAKCLRINLNYDGFDVTGRMFCAGERRGTDVRCQGDNGSPLMYKRRGDEKWAVLGISTKGEKCSQYNRYGIFTRVDEEFTRWINTVTDDCFNDHIPTEIEL